MEEVKETKKKETPTAVLLPAVNIRMKLQKARMLLKRENISKSGKNSFLGNNYYTLSDIQPPITKVCFDVGICPIISFANDSAIMTIYDFDGNETLTITTPMAEIIVDAKKSAMQALMSNETYARRSLYLSTFEIVEDDDEQQTDDIEMHDILMVKTRIERTMTQLLKKGYEFDDILKKMGLDEKKYNGYLTACNTIAQIDKNMKVLLNDKSEK